LCALGKLCKKELKLPKGSRQHSLLGDYYQIKNNIRKSREYYKGISPFKVAGNAPNVLKGILALNKEVSTSTDLIAN